MGKWQMGGEANSLGGRNEDEDVEGHALRTAAAAAAAADDEDVEGHALRSVESDDVETGAEKPGDKARVRARVKNSDDDVSGHVKNSDDDTEGHWGGGAKNSDDDVEGHAAAR